MVLGWETFDAMSPNTNATTAVPASVTKSSMLPVSTGADKPWWTYSHAVGAAMAAAYRMIPAMVLACMFLSPLSTVMTAPGRGSLPDHIAEGLHHTDHVSRADGFAGGERT